ncbi:MAG: molybdopterin molybdotransferase MoeA [Spirosomataceae bacterium]
MISVAEALALILEHPWEGGYREVTLKDANGAWLAEHIVADRAFPPFDRVTLDGIAINMTTLKALSTWQDGLIIPVEGIHFAGQTPKSLSHPTHAMEVMTGAVMPYGADTVIRYEDLQFQEIEGKKYVKIKTLPERVGLNVHHKGTDRREGDLLISEGTKLSPAEIAVAASVGKSTLKVRQMPRMAIISTGDELVDISTKPLLHQIRRSNSYMLQAALTQQGATVELFHLLDDKALIREKVAELLDTFDALILSGGVSEGKADFVPTVLAELGVEKLFHKVAQRPGKPFWFGRSPEGKAVFALPGNPVSTFVCCYKYVFGWLQVVQHPNLPTKAVLAQPLLFQPNLAYFVPVNTHFSEDGQLLATPLRGSGSGDFANLLECDGFLELPPEPTEFATGEVYEFIGFRN